MRKEKKLCKGRCTRPYRECLTHCQGIDLKDNGLVMSTCMKRNLSGLFSPNSPERLHIRFFGNIGGALPSEGLV